MTTSCDLLLRTSARLYSLGVDLDAAQMALEDQMRQGASYHTPELVAAYCCTMVG